MLLIAYSLSRHVSVEPIIRKIDERVVEKAPRLGWRREKNVTDGEVKYIFNYNEMDAKISYVCSFYAITMKF